MKGNAMMIHRRFLLALPAALALAGRAWAQNAPPPSRLRGTIESAGDGTLAVKTQAGQTVQLAVTDKTRILEILPARMEDIKPGSFIGTAAMPQKDGTLMAMEIQVFPEAMRGVGEGHRPWDLKPDSTMTNGTVGDVTGTSGRKLTLKYKGGEQTVTVPAEAPIITYAPGTPAMLTPGAHVIIFAVRDAGGGMHASMIGVGKDGLVPPM
jgi:hypothetical protein